MGASYLAHYGTKGMKWGVWNEETKRKYGMLPAGYKLKRITNTSELSRLDKSRRLYATTNERDFKEYAQAARMLPSVMSNPEKVAVLNMTLKKDAKFADGETAVKMALEKSLGKPLDEFAETELKETLWPDHYGEKHYNTFKVYADFFKDRNANVTLHDVLNSTADAVKERDPQEWMLANKAIAIAVAGTVGSFSKNQYQNAYIDKAKKRGYDIIVDPEDFASRNSSLLEVKEPVIVLNPEETIGDISQVVMKTKKLEEYARK